MCRGLLKKIMYFRNTGVKLDWILLRSYIIRALGILWERGGERSFCLHSRRRLVNITRSAKEWKVHWTSCMATKRVIWYQNSDSTQTIVWIIVWYLWFSHGQIGQVNGRQKAAMCLKKYTKMSCPFDSEPGCSSSWSTCKHKFKVNSYCNGSCKIRTIVQACSPHEGRLSKMCNKG